LNEKRHLPTGACGYGWLTEVHQHLNYYLALFSSEERVLKIRNLLNNCTIFGGRSG
jgi:hypothetical protein